MNCKRRPFRFNIHEALVHNTVARQVQQKSQRYNDYQNEIHCQKSDEFIIF